jgi:hypothetical protein
MPPKSKPITSTPVKHKEKISSYRNQPKSIKDLINKYLASAEKNPIAFKAAYIDFVRGIGRCILTTL